MNQNRRRLAGEEPSTSKRWSSTTKSALEEVNALRSSGDRDMMVNGLADRKTANRVTSISFGNEKVSYQSDAMENQRNILLASHADKAAQAARIKKMKTDLTTTNFKLGDEKDRTEYETTNKTAMNHILTHPMDKSEREEKAAMNKALKEAVKKSSLDFGNEATIYESVMSVDMRKATQGGTSEYARRKQEISDMTASLRKHNFTLGDESKGSNKDMYETDYNSGYGSVPASAYSQRHLDRDEIKKTIEDSRSSHYSLGNGQHKVHYESIAHSSMNTINQDDGGISSALRAEEMKRAKTMKANLTKTSIIMGDDKEYY